MSVRSRTATQRGVMHRGGCFSCDARPGSCCGRSGHRRPSPRRPSPAPCPRSPPTPMTASRFCCKRRDGSLTQPPKGGRLPREIPKRVRLAAQRSRVCRPLCGGTRRFPGGLESAVLGSRMGSTGSGGTGRLLLGGQCGDLPPPRILTPRYYARTKGGSPTSCGQDAGPPPPRRRPGEWAAASGASQADSGVSRDDDLDTRGPRRDRAGSGVASCDGGSPARPRLTLDRHAGASRAERLRALGGGDGRAVDDRAPSGLHCDERQEHESQPGDYAGIGPVKARRRVHRPLGQSGALDPRPVHRPVVRSQGPVVRSQGLLCGVE
jgi:hypothetical protein